MGGIAFILGSGIVTFACGWQQMLAGDFAHLYVYPVSYTHLDVYKRQLLLSYVQLTTLAADTVALKSELTVLQAENVSLTAQHEQMFDMATVKEVAAAAGMAKPTSSQITYLDLDSEDSAVVYRTETPSVFSRILSSLHHGVYAVVEYFD